MTIVNKKSAPVQFDASLHFRATDSVTFQKSARNPGGTASGLVLQDGGKYLLRLRNNPHSAAWVFFPVPDPKPGPTE